MHTDKDSETLFIGWDVGGWNCDNNANSRDALVVLDRRRNVLGHPWRGNLRAIINDAGSTQAWCRALLDCCDAQPAGDLPPVVLAIDTPLGFSQAFQQLVTGGPAAGAINESATNPYLFRYTEQFLFRHGLRPLSPVKDMIGSQATKGMHVLARFAPETTTAGVWQGGSALTAFEAYPSACKPSPLVRKLLRGYRSRPTEPAVDEWHMDGYEFGIDHEDKRDALLCALVAWLFHCEPDALCFPDADTPAGEGWIFAPRDGLKYLTS
ncbi:hypothetical protein [Microbulbifer agarilyticus]|uniref:hypothetical protein n=1 Tax=Microbulbifer agarilyticus TaxID=260552 RepID=UPI0021BC0D89|nr:hypothetical protein [Microbulbifer agarilyticus]